MDIIDLIRTDAAGVEDPSGKTALDSQIETWKSGDPTDLPKSLFDVVESLDQKDWKQWRAFRQIVWRLNLKSQSLSDALAVLTEKVEPTDSRARFYAYLTRADLGSPAPMDELLLDESLREDRPSDWLQLALTQASPAVLHSEYLKLASRLLASNFTFNLGRLREKYGDQFVERMIELCRAMPFKEASDLANLVDDEYGCGIYTELLASHPALRGQPDQSTVVHASKGLWSGLDPEFRKRVTEKA